MTADLSASAPALFPAAKLAEIRAFYATRERWQNLLAYRALAPSVRPVKNLFYGDSITEGWPLGEFFPGLSFLNRGIGGDNAYGLYDRLADDVFAYAPRRVFMLIGINGIEEPPDGHVARIVSVARRMADAGIRVGLCGILPLRSPDNWNRFQYQDRIVAVNAALRGHAEAAGYDFLDYHRAVRDGGGQLAAECAKADGTHVTFEAYRRMAAAVERLL